MRYLWPINDTAYVIGIGRTKVYELVREGELRLVRIGGRSLITDESIRALLRKILEANDARLTGSLNIAMPVQNASGGIPHNKRRTPTVPNKPNTNK